MRKLWILIVALGVGFLALLVGAFLLWHVADSAISLILAVLSGGVLSTIIMIIANQLDEHRRVQNMKRSFGSQVALAVVWARCNSDPRHDVANSREYYVWVPFRPDPFLSILDSTESLQIAIETEDTIRRAVDRMHSFNGNVQTYNCDTSRHRSDFSD